MADSAWTLPEVRAWMEWAEADQKEIQRRLSEREYDFFESTDHGKKLLREKISFAVGGPPKLEHLLRDEVEESEISKVLDLICKQNEGQNSFRVSFLFIACLTREKRFYSPVIRLHLPRKTIKAVFIDNVPRSYHGFQDYLDHNSLPKCLMCFPESGSYYLQENQTFSTVFRRSPACGGLQNVLRLADITSLAVSITVACAGVASMVFGPLVPAAAYVAGGASAVYSAGRSTNRLYDMNAHGASVGLHNPAARNCWLTLGGAAVSAFSIASPLSSWIQAGEAVQVPFVASVTVTGLGVANGITHIVQKRKNGEAIDAKDGVYLAAAIFFFANAVVTTYQANALVEQALAKGFTTDSIYEYVESLITQRPSAAAQERVDFGRLLDSNAVVNLVSIGNLNNMYVGTNGDFSACLNSSCKFIAENAHKYVNKLLAVAESAKLLFTAMDRFLDTFRREMFNIIEWFCQLMQQNSLFQVFGDITTQDVINIADTLIYFVVWLRYPMEEVFESTSDSVEHFPRGLADALELQEQAGTARPQDGVQEWTEEIKLIFELLKKEFERQEKSYQERYKTAKKYSPNLSENEFQEGEGITGPLKEFLWKKALSHMQKDFHSENSLLKLSKGRLNPSPESSGLVDPETGMTVYYYHGVTPTESDQQLSSEQYFSLVREKVGSALVQGSKLEVDRESRLAFFRDLPSNAEGVSCVIVKSVPEDGVVAGHIYVVKGN